MNTRRRVKKESTEDFKFPEPTEYTVEGLGERIEQNRDKKLVDFLMERIGDVIDIVKFADDMKTQTSMIMSREVYRERIKLWQAKLYDYVKRKYGKKILLHSCGAISPIIVDLIEIGVDALDPVQITAKGCPLEN